MEKNKEIILELVRKHFFLSKDGLEKFERYLREPLIDDIYKPMLGSDLRARFKIEGTQLSQEYDQGWKVFNNTFHRLNMYKHVPFTYENYRTNKIIINKNERKLVKYIEEMLFETLPLKDAYSMLGLYPEHINDPKKSLEWIKKYFKDKINEIGALKTPDTGLQVVLSYNFADWFLCSAGEKWSSCVSLECEYGGSYWTGLPGLVGDKNRVFLYVTDGVKKKYNGIVVDRLLSRAWLVMSRKNQIHSLRFYPGQVLSVEEISKLTKLKITADYSRDFISKYPVDLITFETGQSCQIYQDGFGIREDKFISYGHSGYNYLDKAGRCSQNAIFVYNHGLNQLIKDKESIGKYRNVTVACAYCGNGVREGETKRGPDGRDYCDHCWNNRWFSCICCGEIKPKERSKVFSRNDWILLWQVLQGKCHSLCRLQS